MATRQAAGAINPWSDHTLLQRNYQRKSSKNLNILLAAVLTFSVGSAFAQSDGTSPKSDTETTKDFSEDMNCSRAYNEKVLQKVDKYVRNEFFSKEKSAEIWPKALEKQRQKILQSQNLIELAAALNESLDELKTSHCRFLTINDDTYYFLHSLFSREKAPKKVVFPGFITGSAGFESDRVRFVLENSPAKFADISVGDKIVSVDDKSLKGLSNYFGKGDHQLNIEIERDGKRLTKKLRLKKSNMYGMYCEAIKNSVQTFQIDGVNLAYIHLWCGGKEAQEVFADAIADNKIKNSDGLILDLRDGYGACSLDALDQFYRPPLAYPDFATIMRNGKKHVDRVFFDKPMVALINGGSRSGKEMLSFSLKRTKRALLVGDTTAGYFVAGRLFDIDDRSALYLAVTDCELDGQRLEGKGVEPDIAIENDKTSSKDKQLEKAREELVKILKKQTEKPKS